jgi:hypothetical protein
LCSVCQHMAILALSERIQAQNRTSAPLIYKAFRE